MSASLWLLAVALLETGCGQVDVSLDAGESTATKAALPAYSVSAPAATTLATAPAGVPTILNACEEMQEFDPRGVLRWSPRPVDVGTRDVSYTVLAGTAQIGTDFLAASGTLTIPANTQSTSLPATLVKDAVSEPNETFIVELSNPGANAVILKGVGVGTIIDND